MNISVNLPIKKIVIVMVTLITSLAVMSVVTSIIAVNWSNAEVASELPIVKFLNLDHEKNLPTWFSTTLLSLNTMFLFWIAYCTYNLRSRHFLYWFLLAFIFLTLSIDEFISLHEKLIVPIRTLLNTSGLLHFAWIIPIAFLVLIIGLAYLPFILGLSANIRNKFILAACVYIGGAIGIEALGGLRWSTLAVIGFQDVRSDLLYILLTTIEETLEMLGLVIFFYALGTYTYQQQLSEALDNASKQINDNTLNPSSDQQ